MAARGRGRRGGRGRGQGRSRQGPRKQTQQEDESSYTVDDISFVNDPPDFLQIECPVCLQIMLNETLLTNCCGRHFCGPCMRKIQSTGGACPCCNAVRYQSFPNKEKLRTIRGLQVYCNNDDGGCRWKGELKDLSGHINEGKREGDCKFEIVKCKYYYTTERKIYCDVKQDRWLLQDHEKSCSNRPYSCQYCGYQGRYHDVTAGNHFKTCPKYLVPCPNKCEKDKTYQRGNLQSHLDDDCPLQTIPCLLSDVGLLGCKEECLRKDIHKHVPYCNAKITLALYHRLNHECYERISENEEIKQENQTLRMLCHDMRRDIAYLKRKCGTMENRITSLEDKDSD